jgi:hypothetical protein
LKSIIVCVEGCVKAVEGVEVNRSSYFEGNYMENNYKE